MVTAKDVANMAGVSVATVSQILNAKAHRYNKETQARVLASVAKLGYKPNSSARILAGSKTKTIGLIISSTRMLFHEEHYSQLVSRVADLCNQNGYAIYWICMTSDNDANLQIIRSHAGRGIEHFIFFGIPSGIAPIVEEIEAQRSTWILYGENWGTRYVASDSTAGTVQILHHLQSLGVTNFKMALTKPSRNRLCALKTVFADESPESVEQKYIRWMLPLGLIETEFIRETFTIGYQTTGEILAENPAIQAIFFLSDYFAAGALKYLDDHHIKAGKDILIAGFNNTSIAQTHILPIISAEHQIAEIARLLFENVQKPGNVEIKVKPKLIVR